MQSLQRRVILGGVVWAVIAVLVGGFALISVFDQIANRRFNSLLEERHTQIVVALANSATPEAIGELLNDPAYERPYSGRYWQVNGANGEVFASRSLFDTEFNLPRNMPDGAYLWSTLGPDGPVRGIRQKISLDEGSEWTVAVASSVSALQAERAEMWRSVAVAFGFVGVLGIAGAALLTTFLLKPVRRFVDEVSHRWDSGKPLNANDYPTEVAPLIADINQLLERNREVISQGRRQAADLAHALKTPSAALRNELVSLSQKVDGTEPLFEALGRIDAQITRSLARMRAANAANGVNLRTDARHSISRLCRLFNSLPESRELDIRDDAPHPVEVATDSQDFEEMLGNIIENAVKWADARVAISMRIEAAVAVIRVEDDGPGIDADRRKTALEAGKRLDTAVPGTGLGLSIANDLARAYGGTLELGTSQSLGGLAVIIRLPIAAGFPATARADRATASHDDPSRETRRAAPRTAPSLSG